jgi:hypothetical protein
MKIKISKQPNEKHPIMIVEEIDESGKRAKSKINYK